MEKSDQNTISETILHRFEMTRGWVNADHFMLYLLMMYSDLCCVCVKPAVVKLTCRWRCVPERRRPGGADAQCCWGRRGSLSYWRPVLRRDAESFPAADLSCARLWRTDTARARSCCQSISAHRPEERGNMSDIPPVCQHIRCKIAVAF